MMTTHCKSLGRFSLATPILIVLILSFAFLAQPPEFVAPNLQARGADAPETQADNLRVPDQTVFGELNLHRGPYVKNGPGLLGTAAYAGKMSYKRVNYQSSSDSLGEANVQIAAHDRDYRYVSHDFFGVLRQLGKDEKKSSREVSFQERVTERDGRRHVVCYKGLANPPGNSGVVGWLAADVTGFVTVFISYEHLGETPWRLVDSYLSEYSSNISRDDRSLATWERDDIGKWIDLLRTRGTESSVLRLAVTQLQTYDDSSFGLTDAWTKRDDPAAMREPITKAIERMEAWLRDHPVGTGTGNP